MSLRMYPSSPLGQVNSIIAVAAGKGGVGKSTLTVNLALALQAQGYQVGLMDADVYGPSLRKMLREDRLPHHKGEMIEPALCSGIKMISMAYFRKDEEASVVRAPIANQLIAKFINAVNWGKLDFLLIDFPPGTGDVQLTLSQQVKLSGALIVTTPQEVAILDVRKAMKMFELVSVPILGIVENMSYYQKAEGEEKVYLFGREGGERLASETGSAFLGAIPLDPAICMCGDQGTSLFKTDPAGQKSILKAFFQLAQSVVTEVKALDSQESLIKQIQQKNDYTLRILWNDGQEQEICLSELQKNCPCANCTEGKSAVNLHQVKKEVKATAIRFIGRYALQIQFSSGCSTGIYSFKSLKKMNETENYA